jgi:putative transposase
VRWPQAGVLQAIRENRVASRSADENTSRTVDYIDWFNHRRVYQACGVIPPAELEAAYYSRNTSLAEAG